MTKPRASLLLTFALIVFAASAGLIAWKLWPEQAPKTAAIETPAAPETPAAAEKGAEPAAHHVSTIIDLPGDPVLVRRTAVSPPHELRVTLPVNLAASAPKSETAGYFLASPLISPGGGYMGKYTSSGGEAASAAAQLAYNAAVATQGAAAAATEDSDDDGGADTPANAAAQFLTPENSNQVDITFASRPSRQELILKTVVAVKIEDLLTSAGYSAESARAAEAAFKASFNVQSLPAGGAALAYGSLDATGDYRVDQLAIWEGHEYVGAIGLFETGAYGEAARPRAPEGLLEDVPVAQTPAQYTLADGLYSAGLRNGVPENVIREGVELLSELVDLKGSLSADETMRLLYTRDVRAKGKSRAHVIYVGLQGPAGTYECYAYEGADGAYLCFDPKGGGEGKGGGATLKWIGGNSGAVTVAGGVLAPIKGAPITSLFGMRFHPILHILRLHGGIDFGAPVGSQVRAAADGKIEIASEVSGFGNHIRIQHQGFETSYSHLSEIPATIHPGVEVKQGDIIALSGNTGLSTGPHLHFEFYLNGTVTDPLPHLSPEMQASAASLASAPSAPIPPTPPTGGAAAPSGSGGGHPTEAEKAAFPAYKAAVDATLELAAK